MIAGADRAIELLELADGIVRDMLLKQRDSGLPVVSCLATARADIRNAIIAVLETEKTKEGYHGGHN